MHPMTGGGCMWTLGSLLPKHAPCINDCLLSVCKLEQWYSSTCMCHSDRDAAVSAPFLTKRLQQDLSDWIAFLRRICFECLAAVSSASSFTTDNSVIDAFYYPSSCDTSQPVPKKARRSYSIGDHCDPGLLTVDRPCPRHSLSLTTTKFLNLTYKLVHNQS